MTDSKDWMIARTIYTSLEVKGQIKISPLSDGQQELVVAIRKLDVAKLDFHRGSPDSHKNDKIKTSNDDEEDFDEIIP